MGRYKYEVSGLYSDCCQITKNNEVYHVGSLIGLLTPISGDIVIRLNVGSNIQYTYKLRYCGNLVIGVPLEMEYIKNSRRYLPLIFTNEEFLELTNITYMDRDLLSKITECSHQELVEVWLCTLGDRPLCESYHKLKNEILDSIVAFSQESIDCEKLIDILNKPLKIESNQLLCSSVVSIYLYFDKNIEWNSLLTENRNYYLNLDEDFILKYRK